MGAVFPQSHQEIARARHADLIREATQERLARHARDGAPDSPGRVRVGDMALRWALTVVRRVGTRRAAVRTA
jgi:hypothetical protein